MRRPSAKNCSVSFPVRAVSKGQGSRLSILTLREELILSGQPGLVERNGAALFPREFDSTSLAHGDEIELIRVVAGG